MARSSSIWKRIDRLIRLSDRSADSFSRWLKSHPGVELISRDRSTEYLRGATEGAPDAQQVIDRWHLLKNLREVLERLLTRLHDGLITLVQASTDVLPLRPRESTHTRRTSGVPGLSS